MCLLHSVPVCSCVCVQGLLTRDPRARLGTATDAAEVMEAPFFAGLDWHALFRGRVKPPFSPDASDDDTKYFDEQFTNMPVRFPTRVCMCVRVSSACVVCCSDCGAVCGMMMSASSLENDGV